MPEPLESVTDVRVRDIVSGGYEITIRCNADGGVTMISPVRLAQQGKGELTLMEVLQRSRCQRCKNADRKERGKTLTLRWRTGTGAGVVGTILGDG